MPVLILGGTSEARALAACLGPDIDFVSSLAGRVPDPALPIGKVRIGGFGGVDGLCDWLRDNRIDAVVDATHPFAATITANAVAACRRLRIPHLLLTRPPWDTNGSWRVESPADAAKVVSENGFSRIFLTSGRSSAAAFHGSDAWFLIRVVTAPESVSLPRHHKILLSRGPYGYDADRDLMVQHRIDVLVTKNSGGALTRSKLDAAADLGIGVIMIDRPAVPVGIEEVSTVEAAAAWVFARADQPG